MASQLESLRAAYGRILDGLAALDERRVAIVLLVAATLTRLPFLGTFSVVAYDGTYYLNEAKSLFTPQMSGGFPIGYPLAVALLRVLFRNLQLAGQAVSFLAGIGATWFAYRLAREFVRRELAIVAALLLTLNPLFIRLSLMTLSESLYVFLLMVGLWFYVRQRHAGFGLAMSAAAITRPEALAVAGLLCLPLIRRPRRLLLALACFLPLYALNAAVLSVRSERLILLPKSEFLGIRESYWKTRENILEFEGKQALIENLGEEFQEKDEPVGYFEVLGRDGLLVLRYLLPAVLLLALVGFARRRHAWLLPALLPFFVAPLATVRSEARYILPYLPVFIMAAVFALEDERIERRGLQAIGFFLLLATLIILPFSAWKALLVPEAPGMKPMKEAGLAFRDRVRPSERIADRKPFFSFYAGGQYLQIPVAPYEQTLEYLMSENASYLVLDRNTIHTLRPALRPLLYDSALILGELRLRQAWFDEAGVMVYKRIRSEDPLSWQSITPPRAACVAPAWSPDGSQLAFRAVLNGVSGVYLLDFSPDAGSGEIPAGTPRLLARSPVSDDALSWSSDGARLAFARKEEDTSRIYAVSLATGDIEVLTSGEGFDRSPALFPGQQLLAFCSERSGEPQIWMKDLASGELQQVSQGDGSQWPSFSRSGRWFSWVDQAAGPVAVDGNSREIYRLARPREVYGPCAWSPDERHLAVAAKDWGNWDIYLAEPISGTLLLLSKDSKRNLMPTWPPSGTSLTLCSDREGDALGIGSLNGLQPYLDRLDHPGQVQVFR